MNGDPILYGRERESRVSQFPGWALFAVPIAAILFQVYIPLFFQFLGYLELPLIVTIYFALMRSSQLGGMLVGAFVGLAQDSLSRSPLGMFGITKTVVGYVAGSIGARIDVDHPFVRLILAFLLFALHRVIFWVLTHGLLGQQMQFEARRTLVLGFLNGIVAVSLFHFLDKLKKRT